MTDAEYDNGYQQFTNRINARNVDKSLIQDSYFTGADEGGFEIDEVNFAKKEGLIIGSLGNRILRCETAPVCVLSILMYKTKNLWM